MFKPMTFTYLSIYLFIYFGIAKFSQNLYAIIEPFTELFEHWLQMGQEEHPSFMEKVGFTSLWVWDLLYCSLLISSSIPTVYSWSEKIWLQMDIEGNNIKIIAI